MTEVKVTVSHDSHPVMKHILQELASVKNADKPEGLTLQGSVISNGSQKTASQIKAKTRAMINGKVEGITHDDHTGMYKKIEEYVSQTTRGNSSSSSNRSPSGQIVQQTAIVSHTGPVIEEAASDEEPTAKRHKALQPRFNTPAVKLLRSLEAQRNQMKSDQEAFLKQQRTEQEAFRAQAMQQMKEATQRRDSARYEAAVRDPSMQEELLKDNDFLELAADHCKVDPSMKTSLLCDNRFLDLMVEELKDDSDFKMELMEDADFLGKMSERLLAVI